MSFSEKKRFVAGAVCPKCGAMDKVVVFNREGKDYRECVACGFSDQMHIAPPVREMETRVSHSPEEKQAQVQVLQFPPPEDKS